MSSKTAEYIKAAGVVGAGGAGFPTHVKAEAQAEDVIANGAECEPLLQKDREVMKAFPEEVLKGLSIMAEATGAKRATMALKKKHADLVEDFTRRLKDDPQTVLLTLGDFYPAGDEYSLVYDATGRLIPPGGIPLQVGTVVNNVESLLNIHHASEGRPVTETYLTVAGAVKRPCTLKLPIGATFAQAIECAGGATVPDIAILNGGAMMGKVTEDLQSVVDKTSGGLIVLPKDHSTIVNKTKPREQYSRIGRSACDQCSFCTQFCPRYLLGYNIEPHRVMRSLSFAKDKSNILSEWALLCCECSLCSLYACPENLDPKNVCVSGKGDLRDAGITWPNAKLNTGKPPEVHSLREYRKVPIDRLTKRLGLADYKADAPLIDAGIDFPKVRIPLKQHVGAPAQAKVQVGDRVKKGDVLGEPEAGALGAVIHASIDGTVKSVDTHVVIEVGT
jgi:Na+-translocating ferredoxin:NAD+ oxidoreductase RnfC subunit